MPCGFIQTDVFSPFPKLFIKVLYYSKGKCVFKKKVICIWVFYLVLFTCRCHSHLIHLIKRMTIYSAFSSHSKEGVGYAMMLMLRRAELAVT